MSLGSIFKMMYWSLRKNWRVWPHLAVVLVGWLSTLVSLRPRGLIRSQCVAIGLVEHLGDIVAAEPVSRLARRQYPGAKVAWVVRKPYASVPAGFPAVDAVVTVTCLTEWLLLRASGFGTMAWDLHINQRYCARCQIPVLKQGAAGRINAENYYHSGNLLAVECISADIPVLTDGPDLPVDRAAASKVDGLCLPTRLIAIHCASNEASRDWPAENWRLLLSQLWLRLGIAVVEVGTRPVVITEDSPDKRSLCGKLSIAETTEVLRRASLFIGIDSGPAHLANAVGVPGIILLGLYKGFAGYMPYSGRYATADGADIIRAAGAVNTLPVAPVLAAVQRRLGLDPE